MAKVWLICGVICSGKSTLAREIAAREGAVILSCDELTKALGDDLGSLHDTIAARAQVYLRKKTVELVHVGVSVILDWGFWRAADRAAMSEYLGEKGIEYEWRYMDVSPGQLRRNIERRNAHPGASDYFVDDGLLQKCLSIFEPPTDEELTETLRCGRLITR